MGDCTLYIGAAVELPLARRMCWHCARQLLVDCMQVLRLYCNFKLKSMLGYLVLQQAQGCVLFPDAFRDCCILTRGQEEGRCLAPAACRELLYNLVVAAIGLISWQYEIAQQLLGDLAS